MNLRKLDLNLLLVFDTVYKTRSNTKAAEQLGLTQSAVSNALKRLREHLDDPLFQRDGQDFVPTPEADRLAPIVRDALGALEQSISTDRNFDPRESKRQFSFIMPDSMELLILPELFELFRNEQLGVRIKTQPYFGENVQQAVSEKKFDLGFLPNSVVQDGTNSAYLMDEDGCIIARADHPKYLNHSHFSLEDMAKADLIAIDDNIRRHSHIDQELKSKGVVRNHVCLVPRLWSIPYMVANSDLVGAIPRNMAQKLARPLNLRIFELPIQRPTHHWHMFWQQDFEHDPGHIWMRSQILKIVRRIAKTN